MTESNRLQLRSLAYALAASLTWHFFWFFAIRVDVTPIELWMRKHTSIHFVGPVLNDEWFELILESRPEIGATVYRTYEALAEPLEPQPGELEKDLPRDLVAIPMTQRHRSSLQGFLRTEKRFPLSVVEEALPVPTVDAPFPLSDALADRNLLYAPPPPAMDQLALEDPGVLYREAVFKMAVDAQGRVGKIENIVSTGNPEVDLAWKTYLKEWQFMPLPGTAEMTESVGRVRVRKVEP